MTDAEVSHTTTTTNNDTAGVAVHNDSNNKNDTDTDPNDTAPISTSDVRVAVKIRINPNDAGYKKPRTVMDCFNSICQRLGNSPALYQKNKHITSGGSTSSTNNIPEWQVWTWNDYRANVNAFGKSLIHLGCQKYDCINIIGFNAPSWFFANFGAISAGLIPAGVYSTNNSEACYYISNHSNATVIVCEGYHQLEKYYSISKKLKALKALVMYGNDILPLDVKEKCSVPCYTFDEFIKLGVDVSDSALQERTDSWKPGETCTLIYTSGTTGPPKAVMITNDNITWTVSTIIRSLSKGYLDEQDCMVTYLPLSHIAAQLIDMHVPMLTGCQIYFAEHDALKGSLVQTLQAVRPTAFFGVPRVWEKIYDKLQEVAKKSTGITKILSTWAKSEAASYWDSMQYDAVKDGSFNFVRDIPIGYYMAQTLLNQVHKKLGLDRCTEFFVSAAPIDIKLLKYFASLDMLLLEVFGQSECTGPHSINTIRAFKFGTVGRPMIGTETKVDPESGELLYRGRHIFAGYMGMPDKTEETIDPDGWLHSGDIVSIDTDHDEIFTTGFLKVTGRIKELIITAGGENVPPALLEEKLRVAMPALSYAMVVGDKRKFLTVLLTLQVEIDPTDGTATNVLAREALSTSEQIGSTAKTTEEAKVCPKWIEYFQSGLRTANTYATSQAQTIKKYTLLRTDFTEKGGELTPTLKLKRSLTVEKYAAEIDAMYYDVE